MDSDNNDPYNLKELLENEFFADPDPTFLTQFINREDPQSPEEYEAAVKKYWEMRAYHRLTDFINGLRSETTREGARKIIEYLIKERIKQKKDQEQTSEWGGGWIRASNIFRDMQGGFKNVNSLVRLLNDLSAAEIIERRQCPRVTGLPGKSPVFYRVPENYDPLCLVSRGELIRRIYICKGFLKNERFESEAILRVLKKERSDEEIREILAEERRNMRREGYFSRQEHEKFEEPDPCKSIQKIVKKKRKIHV